VRFSIVELEGGETSRFPSDASATSLPRGFGDYEVVEELARGGMGVVYRARQTSLQRTVALKMVAAGHLASPTAVQRFKTEAEAAANLDHPHIVPIYEIGEHEGQHYFTMKLIEGASLDRRLAEFTLTRPDSAPARSRRGDEADAQPGTRTASLRRQLQIANLLARVAEAVHYAHQRGILHRDLKPGNILIDRDGQPHVTDFGLAKRVEAESDLTLSGEIMGTPAYMAPEQAAGNVRQITTAADVFSLGVILYQLLTGRVPFGGKTPVEVFHATIQDQPPAPRAINPGVPRDLETICLKCLEKDPGKRFAGAQEVANELRRFIAGEPIHARPVSRAERVWRWSRRNPALAGFVAATTLLLLTVIVGAPLALWREAALRRQAEAEAVKSRQVAQFLKSVLEGVGPSVALGRDATILKEILDKTAGRVGKELSGHPDIEAELYQTLGETAFQLGDPAKAEKWLRKALALRMESFGEEHGEVANTLDSLALAAYGQGRFAEAEKIGNKALAMQRELHGNNHTNVATSLNNLGITLTVVGRYEPALEAYREALTIRTNLLGHENPEVAVTLNCMAQALFGQGRLRDAEAMQRRALEIQLKVLPDPHPDRALSVNNLANILQVQGKLDQATPYYREALKMQRVLLHESHADLATTLNNYGLLMERMGLWTDAEAAHSNALTIRTNLYRGDHTDLAYTLNNLASLRAARGRYAEAEALYQQSRDMRRRLLGEDKADVAASVANLARVLRQQGRWDEAAVMQTDALARRNRLSPEGEHPSIALSLDELGLIRRAQGRPAEAMEFLRDAFDRRRKSLRPDDSTLAESAENLALVLCDLGEFIEAEKLARQSVTIREGNYPDDWRRFHAQAIIGMALLGQKQIATAEPELLAGYNGMKERETRIAVPDQPRRKEVLRHLVQLYEAMNRAEPAEELRRELSRLEVE
jgi:serine/threonine protein kinase/Tfp pilus assembly protein PilF